MSPQPIFSQFQNSVLFSSCSINQFKALLLVLNISPSTQAQCLLNTPTSLIDPPVILTVKDQLPGQSFTPDDQCKQIHGSQAKFCSEFFYVNICETLFCREDSQSLNCVATDGAVEGTACGSGKVTIQRLK
jgi:hypothetical protein